MKMIRLVGLIIGLGSLLHSDGQQFSSPTISPTNNGAESLSSGGAGIQPVVLGMGVTASVIAVAAIVAIIILIVAYFKFKRWGELQADDSRYEISKTSPKHGVFRASLYQYEYDSFDGDDKTDVSDTRSIARSQHKQVGRMSGDTESSDVMPSYKNMPASSREQRLNIPPPPPPQYSDDRVSFASIFGLPSARNTSNADENKPTAFKAMSKFLADLTTNRLFRKKQEDRKLYDDEVAAVLESGSSRRFTRESIERPPNIFASYFGNKQVANMDGMGGVDEKGVIVTARMNEEVSERGKRKSRRLVLPDEIHKIKWKEIHFQASTNGVSNILQETNTGYVYRATYNNEEVLVRMVITSILSNTVSESLIHVEAEKIILEAMAVHEAKQKVNNPECLIDVHGIIRGKLTKELITELGLSQLDPEGNRLETIEAMALIVKYEQGGTLQSMIHPMSEHGVKLSFREKLRLLAGVSEGLKELHDADIVHGALNLHTVYLSNELNPQIKLSGFNVHTGNRIQGIESVTPTKKNSQGMKRSPLRSSLQPGQNPFAVSKKSKKEDDIHSFALLAWEILSGERPSNKIVGAKKLPMHRKPSITSRASLSYEEKRNSEFRKIPNECSIEIVEMITQCWSLDRDSRRQAHECYALLQSHLVHMEETCIYDVFLNIETDHIDSVRAGRTIYRALLSKGYDIKVNMMSTLPDGSSSELVHSQAIKSELSRSKVILVLLHREFQRQHQSFLQDASEVIPKRPIIPIFIESDYHEWVGDTLGRVCQLDNPQTVPFDISDIVTDCNSASIFNHTNIQETMDDQSPMNMFLEELYHHIHTYVLIKEPLDHDTTTASNTQRHYTDASMYSSDNAQVIGGANQSGMYEQSPVHDEGMMNPSPYPDQSSIVSYEDPIDSPNASSLFPTPQLTAVSTSTKQSFSQRLSSHLIHRNVTQQNKLTPLDVIIDRESTNSLLSPTHDQDNEYEGGYDEYGGDRR